MKREKRFISLLAITIFAAAPLAAQNWPQWRGPGRDGLVSIFRAPAAWPAELKQVWRVPAGAGLSSPVAGNGLVFLLTRDGDEEVVTCWRVSDGTVVWSDRYQATFFPTAQAVRPRLFPNSGGKGPFATPLLHGGRLYTLGVTKILTCYDAATGRRQWRQAYFQEKLPEKAVYFCPPCNNDCDNKKYSQPGACPGCGMALAVEGVETTTVDVGNYYGTAASPLMAGPIGVVQVKTPQGGEVIAFDPASGRQVWSWSGPVPASASPVAADIAGLAQVVVVTRESCVGLNSADGSELWQVPINNNAQIVTHIVFQDLVIFAEYRLPLKALRIGRDGERWRAEPAWENTDHPLLMNTPVLYQGTLYGFDTKKRGRFFSADALTGETRWVDEGNRGENAVVLGFGDTILGLTDSAELVIFKTGGDLTRIASYQVADSPVWTYPILWERSILIKDAANLTLWYLE